jgi:hypothetical protein
MRKVFGDAWVLSWLALALLACDGGGAGVPGSGGGGSSASSTSGDPSGAGGGASTAGSGASSATSAGAGGSGDVGGFDSLRRDAPFVRSGTVGLDPSHPEMAIEVNDGTNSAVTVADLARWYVYLEAQPSPNAFGIETLANGQTTTLAQKLHAAGVQVSAYHNGSHAMAKASASAETNIPLGISTFWCGQWDVASGGANSAACRVTVDVPKSTPPTVDLPISLATVRPGGAPAEWPFKPTTPGYAGATSKDAQSYVSWLRLDDEVLKILAIEQTGPTTAKLTVTRGLWGTAPAAHPAGSRVLSPVYVGGTSNDGGAQDHPDSGGQLSYALRVDRDDVVEWIASATLQALKTNQDEGPVVAPYVLGTGAGSSDPGFDSVFFDVSAPGFFNKGDAFGNAIVPWDDRTGALFTVAQTLADQHAKVDRMRMLLEDFNLRFVLNNYNVSGGSDVDLAKWDGIEAGFADAYFLEAWLGRPNQFDVVMEKHFAMQAHDDAVKYYQKTFEASPQVWGSQDTAAEKAATQAHIRRFTYGAYLLGWSPSAANPVLVSDYCLDRPADFLFWDLGAPVDAPGSLDDVAVDGATGVYRRDFANGFVVVNATPKARSVAVGGEALFDASSATKNSIPTPIEDGTLTLPGYEARIVLRGTALDR